MFRARTLRFADVAVIRRVAIAASALLLTALFPVRPAIAEAIAEEAPAALAACQRRGGDLARYLLCLDLNARRPEGSHAAYYEELGEIERTISRGFPRRKRPMRLLPRMLHADRWGTEYRPGVSFVDSLDARRHGRKKILPADCDLYSILNVSLAERYFSAQQNPIGMVRTRYDHVVTAAFDGPRMVGLLETVNGDVFALTGGAIERRLQKQYSGLRAMTEEEILAIYLSNIGLALQFEGDHRVALSYFDEAIRRNPQEYVAHVGLSLSLFDLAERAPTRTGARSLLVRAEAAGREALRLEPIADGAWTLVGRLRLRQGDAEEAERMFAHAVELRSGPFNLFYLGAALEAQQRPAEALRVLKRARKSIHDPKHPDYRRLVVGMNSLSARAHTELADRHASEKDLRRAMAYHAAVASDLPDNESVQQLGRRIDLIDRRIGPVQRAFGIPRSFGMHTDAELAGDD